MDLLTFGLFFIFLIFFDIQLLDVCVVCVLGVPWGGFPYDAHVKGHTVSWLSGAAG